MDLDGGSGDRSGACPLMGKYGPWDYLDEGLGERGEGGFTPRLQACHLEEPLLFDKWACAERAVWRIEDGSGVRFRVW